MKKNFIRLLAGTMALSMLLTLAACGGNNDSGSSQSSSSSQSSEAGAPDSSVASEDNASSAADSSAGSSTDASAGDGAAVGEKYASIQAFLDDPEVKTQIDAMVDAMASSGNMNITVTAEGSKLIYTFTFPEFEEGTDMDAVATQLEDDMTQQAATFEGIAGELKAVVEEANPTVVVTYKAADGSDIYSKEFSAS